MLFVGIDVAKSHHDVAVLDDNGLVVLRHLRILNSRQGFATLHQSAQKSINWTIFIQLLRQHLRYDCDYKN